MSPTLLWVGLGNIGRGMCKNLVEKGNLSSPLLIYNRTTQKATDLSDKLASGKSQVVESLADGVSKADIIFTCVSNDDAVKDVTGTILEGDVQGKLFIDCSTIHPDTTEALAKSVKDKGADFVAAPVFGAPVAAEAGQLIAVLAGPKSSVDKAKPWFKGVTSRAEIDFSDQPYHKATTLKVLGNTLIIGMVEQLSEAYAVAEKVGLGTGPVKQLLDNLYGGIYSTYSQRMLTGDYYKREEPLFGVDLALKDIRHARSLRQAAGVTTKDVDYIYSQLEKVQKHAGSSGDLAGLYGAARLDADLKFENGD